MPEASFSDLLGKQSVRATFRLSERAIDAISLVAGHLGIKKKSLFDHLIEDSKALHTIARNFSSLKVIELPRVQKTFVLSRRTLIALEQISKTFDTPRDALVEHSIQRLDAIIRSERHKHELRKQLIGELEAHIVESKALLDKARDMLGHDDAVCVSLEKLMASDLLAYRELEDILEKGRLLEEF
ncbi:MAG: hypothetical protein KKD44_16965 [Proteobacteria bacterium]|nr:hypothetical protein [Pseudomonadota bacterium]